MYSEKLFLAGVLGTFVLIVIAMVRAPEYLSQRRTKLRKKQNRDNGRVALVYPPYEFDLHEQTHGIDALDAFLALRQTWMRENPRKRVLSTSMLTKKVRGRACFDGILIEYRKIK